ncbi:hypothetical protein BC828DRAFT_77912 [Blastocladiella britannica]|nr:hypothetical protein BC828DRAFT_77912 [Blastocladiella britannica]
MQRDQLFELSKLTVELLRGHLNKPNTSIDPTLLDRLLRAILMVPAFTDRQKMAMLDIIGNGAFRLSDDGTLVSVHGSERPPPEPFPSIVLTATGQSHPYNLPMGQPPIPISQCAPLAVGEAYVPPGGPNAFNAGAGGEYGAPGHEYGMLIVPMPWGAAAAAGAAAHEGREYAAEPAMADFGHVVPMNTDGAAQDMPGMFAPPPQHQWAGRPARPAGGDPKQPTAQQPRERSPRFPDPTAFQPQVTGETGQLTAAAVTHSPQFGVASGGPLTPPPSVFSSPDRPKKADHQSYSDFQCKQVQTGVGYIPGATARL